jgi:pyruvate, water dikinase
MARVQSPSRPAIAWIDATDLSAEQLGGKVASLAEMTAAGFNVPLAFAVTTEAFRSFAAQAGLTDAVRAIRRELDHGDLPAVDQASAEIAGLIERAPISAQLEQDIRTAYARLEDVSERANVPVAVRSSGVNEDLAGASFAGQYETYLWICGAEQVLAHVRRCWAGLFSATVLTYEPHHGVELGHEQLHGMCVGVQRMVDSRTAGVMFTIDPVTGDRSTIVIESCWGLGEGVVKGDVTPDRHSVDKVTLELIDREVGVQTHEYRFDERTGAVGLTELEADHGERNSLHDAEVRMLAELGKRVERHRGAPQDIEWAIDSAGALHLLQARPETIWSTKSATQADSSASTGAVDRVLSTFMGIGTKPKQ